MQLSEVDFGPFFYFFTGQRGHLQPEVLLCSRMYKRRDWLHVHGPDGGDSSDDDDSSINSDADGVGKALHQIRPPPPQGARQWTLMPDKASAHLCTVAPPRLRGCIGKQPCGGSPRVWRARTALCAGSGGDSSDSDGAASDPAGADTGDAEEGSGSEPEGSAEGGSDAGSDEEPDADNEGVHVLSVQPSIVWLEGLVLTLHLRCRCWPWPES